MIPLTKLKLPVFWSQEQVTPSGRLVVVIPKDTSNLTTGLKITFNHQLWMFIMKYGCSDNAPLTVNLPDNMCNAYSMLNKFQLDEIEQIGIDMPKQ